MGCNQPEAYFCCRRMLNNRLVTATLKGHAVSVTALAVPPSEDNSNLIVSGSYDTNVKLWDLRQKGCVNTFKGHTMQVNAVQITPDCRWIASGSSDCQIKVWDISTFKLVSSLTQHDGPINCLRFNPQEYSLASSSFDRTVKYWDLDKFSLVNCD